MPDRVLMKNQTATLIDVLDRILDKGIVVIGDITISLCNVELLSIKLKLLIASVEKAKAMGIDFGWAGEDKRRLQDLDHRVRTIEGK